MKKLKNSGFYSSFQQTPSRSSNKNLNLDLTQVAADQSHNKNDTGYQMMKKPKLPRNKPSSNQNLLKYAPLQQELALGQQNYEGASKQKVRGEASSSRFSSCSQRTKKSQTSHMSSKPSKFRRFQLNLHKELQNLAQDNNFDEDDMSELEKKIIESERASLRQHQEEGENRLELTVQPIVNKDGTATNAQLTNSQFQLKRETELYKKEPDLRTKILLMLKDKESQVLILKKSVVYLYHDDVKIYGLRSLFFIHGENRFRKAAVWLVNWRPFDLSIIMVIMLNSVALALYDYNDRDSETYNNQVIDTAGKAFTVIFTVEGALEIIARGFILHKNAYLRDGWCLLDFFVLVSGLIEFTTGSVKLKSLRVLRALRPLRSITAFPSMKKLVSAMIQSMPDFINVGIFLFFVFILFSILGVHQYNGQFYNACRYNPVPETNTSWAIDESFQRACSKTGYGNFICPTDRYCGNPAEFGIPLENENIVNKAYVFFGIHNFNSIWTSLQVVFQMVTNESWALYMYALMDVDSAFFAAMYSILIVVVGSFFLMNLILAVIIQAFISITKRDLENEIKKLNQEDAAIAEILERIEEVEQLDSHRDNISEESSDAERKQHLFVKSKKSASGKKQKDVEIQDCDDENVSKALESIEDLPKKRRFSADLNDDFENNQINKEESSGVASTRHKKKDAKQRRKSFANKYGSKENGSNGSKVIKSSGRSPRRKSKFYSGSGYIEGEESENDENEEPEDGDLSFLKSRGMQRKVVNIFNVQDNVKTNNLKQSDSSGQSHPVLTNQQSEQHTQVKTQNLLAIENNNLIIKKESSDSLSKKSSNSYRQSKSAVLYKGSPRALQANKLISKQLIMHGITMFEKEERLEGPMQERLEQYLIEKQTEIKLKGDMMANVLKKQSTIIESKFLKPINEEEEIKEKSTIRSLATVRFRIDLRRQQHHLSKYYRKFKLECRADQNKFYFAAYQICQDKYFHFVVTLVILFNTIILSLDKYPDTDDLAGIFEKFNFTFTAFFIIEMVTKLLGLGFKGYIWDPYNVFDAIIVIASASDLLISNLLNTKSGGVITAIRSFRLLRLFKLAKQWKRLHYLLKTIAQALKDVGTFSILLLLFIYSFALLGMEIFAYKVMYEPDGLTLNLDNGTPPDSNFDTLVNAFTSVFILLTSDGWSSIYFNHWRALQNEVPTLYFIGVIIIGRQILLNLFLAILLENFDENNLREQIQKEIDSNMDPNAANNELILQCYNALRRGMIWLLDQAIKIRQHGQNLGDTIKVAIKDEAQLENSSSNLGSSIKEQKNQQDQQPDLQGLSLQLLSPENRFRLWTSRLVQSRKFQFLIIVAILISTIQLALETPLRDPTSKTQYALYYIDIATTSIFFVECLFNILSFGFLLNGKRSYLKNPWNIIDFVIIVLSILSLTPLSDHLRLIKMFRILRVFRLIGRNESLKVGVKALLYAIPKMLNVTIILLFFFLMFGVLCVSYFKGKLYYCLKDQVGIEVIENLLLNPDLSKDRIIRSKWDCINAGGEWFARPFCLNNILNAIYTLFIMATTSSWADQMYLMAAATAEDYQQSRLYQRFWLFFCIFFIIVSAFLLLNLFVGVVISTFNSEQDKLGGRDLLSEKQKEWIEARLLILRTSPINKSKAPENRFRYVLYRIQKSKYFENFILGSIVLNTFVLALKWYQQPMWMDVFTDYLNYIFFAIFFFEATIRIIAIGVKDYFSQTWNIFDFVVVVGSGLSIALFFTIDVKIKGATTIIRAFRILRVVRLIKRAKSLQLIFNTFIVSIPALTNIGGLLLLVLYLYSIVGVQMLGQVKRNYVMTDNLNFETFSNAFCTLCAVSIGDSWEMIVQSLTKSFDIDFQCIDFPTYEDYSNNGFQTIGCGANWDGQLYFLSFYISVNLIFLNLFIAIVLMGYSETQCLDQRLFNMDMIESFRLVWADFDPEGTTFIKIAELKPFLTALGEPLGFTLREVKSKALQDKFIALLQLPTYGNFTYYNFVDVLDALSLRLMALDHTIKYKLNKLNKDGKDQSKEDDEINDDMISSEEEEYKNTEEQQEEFKQQIQQDINKLLLRQEAEGILAVKEIKLHEQKMDSNQREIKKDAELTSMHHAAAEVAVLRMRKFLQLRRVLHAKKLLAQQRKVSQGVLKGLLQVENPDNIKHGCTVTNFHFEGNDQLFDKDQFSGSPRQNPILKQQYTTSDMKYSQREQRLITQVIDELTQRGSIGSIRKSYSIHNEEMKDSDSVSMNSSRPPESIVAGSIHDNGSQYTPFKVLKANFIIGEDNSQEKDSEEDEEEKKVPGSIARDFTFREHQNQQDNQQILIEDMDFEQDLQQLNKKERVVFAAPVPLIDFHGQPDESCSSYNISQPLQTNEDRNQWNVSQDQPFQPLFILQNDFIDDDSGGASMFQSQQHPSIFRLLGSRSTASIKPSISPPPINHDEQAPLEAPRTRPQSNPRRTRGQRIWPPRAYNLSNVIKITAFRGSMGGTEEEFNVQHQDSQEQNNLDMESSYQQSSPETATAALPVSNPQSNNQLVQILPMSSNSHVSFSRTTQQLQLQMSQQQQLNSNLNLPFGNGNWCARAPNTPQHECYIDRLQDRLKQHRKNDDNSPSNTQA